MRIGLTCDIAADWAAEGLDPEELAEFDGEETIAAIEAVLRGRGHDVERIGRAEALVARLAQGARWDLVFNMCEGLRGPGREALVPALLDAYGIACAFSDALVLALTLHKAHTKRVLRDAGLPTADFAVLDDAREAHALDLRFPLFAKPVGEGTGKGIGGTSFCRTPGELAQVAATLIARFAQPVLAEEYLPGREFTVGVLGSGAGAHLLGVMEIRSPNIYGFATKKDYAAVTYHRAEDAEARAAGAIALAAWRALGCRDGGRVDLRSDAAGRPMFLEVNPLAGLHPRDSDLVFIARFAGHDHAWLIDAIMREACARLGLSW